MSLTRGTTSAVLIIILGTSLISGSVVDFTAERSSLAAAGNGSADVNVGSVPNSITLRRSDADESTFYLQANPARMRVSKVRGRPLLVYELRIPALGFSSVRKYVLSSSTAGPMPLRLASGTFDASDLEQGTYTGTFIIRIEGDEIRTVYRRNVTVEVDG